LLQTNNSEIKVQLLYPKADFNDARYPLYTKYVVPEGTDRGKSKYKCKPARGQLPTKEQGSASQPIIAHQTRRRARGDQVV
jgi:hypothetical protein